MPKMVTVEVEDEGLREVFRAFEGATEDAAKRAAEVTAKKIVVAARSRVRRATGETQRGITAEELREGESAGWIVFVDNDRMPNLPIWIEFGTDRSGTNTVAMAARPFLLNSARLEENGWLRRLQAAVGEAARRSGG